MKTIGLIACAIVTMDCINNAMGDQALFAPGVEWLWWLVAAWWFINTLAFAFMHNET